jgi:predicted metal-dependent hydrolase
VSARIIARAQVMGVHVQKVSVRKMRSRWGSCSRDGNISINLLLGHLPDGLLEYVVVHELCHLVHHSHSHAFWMLLKTYLPDFKQSKMALCKYGYLLRQKKPE